MLLYFLARYADQILTCFARATTLLPVHILAIESGSLATCPAHFYEEALTHFADLEKLFGTHMRAQSPLLLSPTTCPPEFNPEAIRIKGMYFHGKILSYDDTPRDTET